MLEERGHDPDELIERNLKVYEREEAAIADTRAKRVSEYKQRRSVNQ